MSEKTGQNIANLNHILSDLGFSELEVEVYELLLREGSKKAIEISKQCKISRTNTYNILAELEDKKVIRKVEDTKVARFAAEHPQALQEFLLKEKKSLDTSQAQLSGIMGKLLESYNLSDKQPGVFRFEGKAGLERVYGELLEDGDDIDIIMDRPRLRRFLGDYNDKFVGLRRRKKICTRVITTDYERVDSDDKLDLRDVRYIDAKLFPFEMDIKVTKNKVVLTTLKEESAVGIIIADSEIAKNFRVLYDFFWSVAKV